MTDTPPATVMGTIESTRTARRKEESARKFVVVSFPVRGNAELIGRLEEQLGNGVEVTFAQPEQPLLKQVAATETVNGHVDGQPAKIRRTKVSNETKAKLDAMQEASKTNHVFVLRTEDEFCEACGQATEAGIHVVPSFGERYQHYVTDPDSSGYNHSLNAADLASDDVDNGRAQQLTDEEAAFYEALQEGKEPEPLSSVAQALIDASSDLEDRPERRTPANEEEAQQQREGEAALAARGR